MIPEKSKTDGTYVPLGSGTHTRTKAAAETVTYVTTRLNRTTVPYEGDTGNTDFYRGDGNGFCDNAECHGGAPWWPGPAGLSGIMRAGGSHSGGQQDAGADCESCHRHNSGNGGWTAQ